MTIRPRTPAARDDGRSRVGNITLIVAAGGVAGVGLLAGVAKASTTSTPSTKVQVEAPADGGDGTVTTPSTAPATSPPDTATSAPSSAATRTPASSTPSSSAAPRATPTVPTTQPTIIQPPTQSPSTGRHRRPSASSGGS